MKRVVANHKTRWANIFMRRAGIGIIDFSLSVLIYLGLVKLAEWRANFFASIASHQAGRWVIPVNTVQIYLMLLLAGLVLYLVGIVQDSFEGNILDRYAFFCSAVACLIWVLGVSYLDGLMELFGFIFSLGFVVSGQISLPKYLKQINSQLDLKDKITSALAIIAIVISIIALVKK